MTCEKCKWSVNNRTRWWCARHAPIAIENKRFEKGRDEQMILSIQPTTYPTCFCGDFESREKE